EIPAEKISDIALNALMEEFILREGTDYEHSETTLDDKKKNIQKQLEAGLVKIVFSSLTENTTIMLSSELVKSK
ncbi:unnamed protein product, partial [marine sediment metagenome]